MSSMLHKTARKSFNVPCAQYFFEELYCMKAKMPTVPTLFKKFGCGAERGALLCKVAHEAVMIKAATWAGEEG